MSNAASGAMELQQCNCTGDIGCDNHMLNFVMWQMPYLLLLSGGIIFWFYTEWGEWLWVAGFGLLGIACISNALHCKRKHCFFTGPIYLILGILSALINLKVLSISWGYIWLLFLLGTVLSYIPEWGGQKYFRYDH